MTSHRVFRQRAHGKDHEGRFGLVNFAGMPIRRKRPKIASMVEAIEALEDVR
jgi:hypothetical protein